MSVLHFPWIELAVLAPLLGALWLLRVRDPDQARKGSLIAAGVALLAATGGFVDFLTLHIFEAHDRWDVLEHFLNRDLLVIDELGAPLLPLTALLYFLTILATLRTKARRFSFALALVSESLALATFACKIPWGIVVLLIAGVVPPLIELRRRGRPTHVFALHMGVFALLLVFGQWLAGRSADPVHPSLVAVAAIGLAVLLRNGVVPVHCWLSDLFENASFGSALLFVAPMPGVYGAMRLLLPVAPSWMLQLIAVLSLTTAVYAAGLALVQQDSRRFFSYLFLSHSSLVLVGLEIATRVGLTGALCVWLSVGLSLGAFGLTLRAVESRVGRISLAEYHGLYPQLPLLAAFFLLTGLASIGFPGTVGFVGTELLIDGAVEYSPAVGVLAVIAGALNGLAIMQVYFRIFTGARHPATVNLTARPPERVAMLVFTLLILLGGWLPQPGVASRYHAARELHHIRASRSLGDPGDDDDGDPDDNDDDDPEDDNDDDRSESVQPGKPRHQERDD